MTGIIGKINSRSKIVGKTIVTDDITDDAVALNKLAQGADGSLITYDASTNPALVPPGTSGHVLTSRGNASTPTFQVVAGPAVLQVKSTIKRDTFSTTTQTPSMTTVSGLSVAITPAQASSKILCIASFTLSSPQVTGAAQAWLRRKVASGSYSEIGAGTDASSRPGVNAYSMPTDVRALEMITVQHLDDPTYNVGQALTYEVAMATQNSAFAVVLGQTGSDENAAYVGRVSSHITVMEVAT
mgnify:CR=1 FL=1